MVYRVYRKKGGNTFGPYYYESYRDGEKVKKVYIGDSKDYKKWARQKNERKISLHKKSVEQHGKKFLNTVFAIALILLAVSVLTFSGSFAYRYSIPNNFLGFSISESVYNVGSKEILETRFDSGSSGLEIKKPEVIGFGIYNKNKNKRMEFLLPEGNLRLYFDLVNYSEVLYNVDKTYDNEEIGLGVTEFGDDEIRIIADRAVIEAEDFDIVVDSLNENEEDIEYKWGYEVRLSDLHFLAKIDITSEESISYHDDNTLRIGEHLLGFDDLAAQGYDVRIGFPVLGIEPENLIDEEINITEPDSNFTESNETISNETASNESKVMEEISEPDYSDDETDYINITYPEEEGLTEQESNFTESESNFAEPAEEGIDVGVPEEVIEDTPAEQETGEYSEEPVIEESKEEALVQETEEDSEEQVEEQVEEEPEISVTGNIIRTFAGLTGFVAQTLLNIPELSNVTEEYVNDALYENTISVYIEKDFTGSNYNTGDIINLDPTLRISGAGDPHISFVSPTPANNSGQRNNNIFVNVSSSDDGVHYAFIDFDSDVVVWMRMDDVNSSGSPFDNSSYGNNGSAVNGAVQNASGYFGKSFTFDGVNDEVIIPYNDTFDMNTNLTVSFWLNPAKTVTNPSSPLGILSKSSTSTSSQNDWGFFWVNGDSGRMRWGTYGDNIQTTTNTWNAGTWYHVTTVHYNSTYAEIYVNGVLDNNGGDFNPGAIDGTLNNPIRIGNSYFDPTGALYYNGSIDELIVLNRTLNAVEVAALYNASANQTYRNFTGLGNARHNFTAYAVNTSGNVNKTGRVVTIDTVNPLISYESQTEPDYAIISQNYVYVNVSITEDNIENISYNLYNESLNTSGLVGYWNMDRNLSVQHDLSSSGNDGDVNGSLFNSSGKLNSAYNFDGFDDYIDINDTNLDFQPNESLTIAYWVNFAFNDNATYRSSMINKRNDVNAGGWELQRPGSHLVFVLGNSGSTKIGVQTNTNLIGDENRWYHIAVTYNGSGNASGVAIYINGSVQAPVIADDDTGATITYQNNTEIGANFDKSNTFFMLNGSMDEVMIWNRSLPAAEISNLYNRSAVNRSVYSSRTLSINWTGLNDNEYHYFADVLDIAENYNSTGIRNLELDTTFPLITWVNPTPADGATVSNNFVYLNTTITDETQTSAFFDFNRSLRGYWSFDYFNSTAIFDNSSFGNNGNFTGGLGTSNITNSRYGNGIDFDGVNDETIIAYSDDFDMSSNLTVAFWFNPANNITDPPSRIGLMSKSSTGTDANNDWGFFFINGDSGRMRWGTYGDNIQTTTNDWFAGTWYYVTVLHYNSTYAEIYVNGVLDNNGGDFNPGAIDGTLNNPLRIGSAHTTGAHSFYEGRIDEVKVWSRILSGQEINASYNNSAYRLERNYTNLVEGFYNYSAFAIDEAGNLNISKRTFTFSLNQAPNTPVVNINSTNGSNKTLQDLNCYATITDPDANNLNVTVEWFKNNTKQFAFDFNNSYSNGTLFIATMDDGNTTKGDIWKCGLRLFDGTNYSIANSSNLTILNTVPTLNLSSPANDTTTTDRTPTFNWSANDEDNDALTFELVVNLTAASTCFESDRYITGISESNHTLADYLKCLWDNNDFYTWEVRAYDGENYSLWTQQRTIKIQSEIILSVPVNNVNFGTLDIFDKDNTTDDSPQPFVINNSGNALVNISANFSFIFEKVQAASQYYRYKARNRTSGCFVIEESVINFTDASSITSNVITRLNFTSGFQTGCNNASLDILLEVPPEEPPGNKSSIATFIASLAETD